MMKLALATITAVVAMASLSPAQAAQIDLSTYVDANISTYTDGGAYPGAGITTIGGIDFLLAGYQGGTGIIRGAANMPVNIAVNEANVSKVYAIVNSADGGQEGTNIGSIVFNAASGISQTVQLIEGVNVRDHYSGVYNNSTTTSIATADYPGGAHFDVYEYDLPTFAGSALSSISFTSRELGFPYGSPFIAGITTSEASVAAVPEPATWAMMVGGIGVVGGAMRRAPRKNRSLATA